MDGVLSVARMERPRSGRAIRDQLIRSPKSLLWACVWLSLSRITLRSIRATGERNKSSFVVGSFGYRPSCPPVFCKHRLDCFLACDLAATDRRKCLVDRDQFLRRRMVDTVAACLDFERDLREFLLVFFRPVRHAIERVLYVRIHSRSSTMMRRPKPRRRSPDGAPAERARNPGSADPLAAVAIMALRPTELTRITLRSIRATDGPGRRLTPPSLRPKAWPGAAPCSSASSRSSRPPACR